jgi:hypothetical protein
VTDGNGPQPAFPLIEGRFGVLWRVMERVKGIEPSLSAWEADVLPLNYTRERPYCTRSPEPVASPLPSRQTSYATPAGPYSPWWRRATMATSTVNS